ncbi:MAG: fused MFS/spermidine synthase, partial [Planctomycetes bacterium]|nr:fused MFS/spermidine synthase [Planctomycetota bacterium]
MSSRQTRTLILILFLLSGSAGLVYEIVWMKMLTLIIGSTTFATTTVLTSFMGGLALGSFVAGKFVDRRTDHLKIYGILEGAIGAYALALPMLLGWTEPLFRFIYQNFHTSFYTFGLLRFLVCGLVLLIPTTLMGATLPVLSKYFVERQSRLGWTIGKLYGVNTFGAVAGALAAGFVLIPALGVSLTIYTAALLNLAIAAAVLMLSRGAAATAPEPRGEQLEKELNSEKERRSKKERESRKERRSRKERESRKVREIEKEPVGAASLDNRTMVTVMLVMGLSGVAAMIYQIAWTRVLALSIGSSVYAFSLIVGAFIGGLALGSVAIARLVDRRKNLVLMLAMVQVGIGISALLLVPILGNLPMFVAGNVLRLFQSFADVHLAEFAVIFLLMLLPTVLMGGAFPIAIKICAPDLDRLGKLVGNVYAVNTLGAIIGSFGAGFLLIPWLGTENAIVVAAAINLAAAGLIVAQSTVLVPRTRVALVAGAIAIVSLAGWRMPRWDEFILTSGPYLYADLYRDLATEKDFGVDAAMREGYKLLYFREGLSAVVSVKETADGDIALEVNGKTDATAKGDASTQLMLGHLPLLLHENARDVLVIGLGSGMTLGAVAQRPVESIDVVELEAAIVEASEFFRDFNGDALSDPRVEVVVADGRTHLAFTDKQYDVIISEPSNVWVSGMANLFTREFFASAMGRLRAGGIVCQWVHAYTMSPEDFKTIVNTFSSVFPHTMVWEADFGNDYLLIGHVDDLSVDYATLEQRLSDDRIRDDLLRMNAANVASFVGKLIMVDEAIAEYASGAPLHTDDNFLLEYSAPRAVLKDRSSILVSDLYRHRSDLSQALQALGWSEDEATGDGLARVLEAKRELAAGYVDFLEGAQ